VTLLLLLGFGFVVLIPTWLVLPPDDEDLAKEIVSTVFQSREVFAGRYPFWDPWVAFGVPQPPTQTLAFHPFVVFIEVLPLGAAIGLLYQVQLWIGLLSVWAVARHFGLRRAIAGLSVLTYALSSIAITYLTNFWPVMWVDFTLGPLLVLLLLKLFDATTTTWRVVCSVGAGLCAALMVLDGHVPSLVDYALPIVAFLVAQHRRVRQLWVWLGVSLTILVLGVLSDVYDIALESSRAATARNNQETVGMNVWRLLMYPISAPFHQGNNPRALAIGGPFFLLAAIGLVYPLRHRYANALRAAAAVSFVQWFVPVRWTAIRGGNFFSAAPFTIFAVFLAALTLQALWTRFARVRPLLVGAAALQVIALFAGFAPFYRDGLSQASAYFRGSPSSHTLKRVLENQPIYAYFERIDGIRNTRVYFAPGADARMFREAWDYRFPGWPLHDLRLVNGLFKGIDMHEIAPARVYLRGEIRGDSRVAGSALTLDALDIGYVLATPDDHVAGSLARVATFHLDHPAATIVVYRNPTAWPDAVVLDPRAGHAGPLPRRAGCSTPGLLCADFGSAARLRRPADVRSERWIGTDLSVTLAKTQSQRVLMLSQLYRPGWRARLSDGRTVSGYSLFGGFTGFDLPAGVGSARISYHPTARIVLTGLSWATILLGLLAMVAVPLCIGGEPRPSPDGAGTIQLLLHNMRHPHHPSRQFVRFAVVGLVNTVITIVIYSLLLGVGTPYLLAAPLGFAAGSTNGYVFNRRWTLAASDSMRTRATFVVVQALGAGLTSLLVLLFVEAAGAGKLVAYIAAIPPVTVGTFLANRRWTFVDRS
jgi:putative flippase GtrA